MEQSDQSPEKPLVNKAMYITYLALLYTGLFVILIGILILADGDVDDALPLIIFGSMLNVAGSILMLIMFHRFWDYVIRALNASNQTPSIETPGKAIGYLFIPFYNFYWIFMTYGKIAKDLNALAGSKSVTDRLPENYGNIIAVLVLVGIIPYVGYITSAVCTFVMLPIFIKKIIHFIEIIPGIEARTEAEPESGKTASLPTLESIHDHSRFFNSNEYGINYPVGIALFLGLIVAHLVWMLGDGMIRHSFFMIFTRYYLPMILADGIMAYVFLFLIHSVKKDIILFVAFGLVLVLLGLLKRYVYIRTQIFDAEDIVANPIMIPRIIHDFFYGAFFMAGVVYSIRYLGLKWWSISVGLIIAYLAAYLLTEFIGLPMGSGFYFRFKVLLISFINYAIQGFSIWLGIRYFAIKKGIVSG